MGGLRRWRGSGWGWRKGRWEGGEGWSDVLRGIRTWGFKINKIREGLV